MVCSSVSVIFVECDTTVSVCVTQQFLSVLCSTSDDTVIITIIIDVVAIIIIIIYHRLLLNLHTV